MGAFHSSDVDVQATRLLVLFFLELLQHPSERSMDNIAVFTLIEISRGQRMARYQTPTSQIERQKYERLLERGRSKQARYRQAFPKAVRDYNTYWRTSHLEYFKRHKDTSTLTQDDKAMLRQWQTENPGKVPTKEDIEVLQSKTKGKAPHNSIRNYLSLLNRDGDARGQNEGRETYTLKEHIYSNTRRQSYATIIADRIILVQNPGGGQQEVEVGRQGRG